MEKKAKETLLQKIPYGVFVIGVKNGKEISGFTASWVQQISFDPPMIAVSVKAVSKTFLDMLKTEKAFSVNFLSTKQKKIAEKFFNSPEVEGDYISGLPYVAGKTGVPVLEHAQGHLECIVEGNAHPGDHVIFFGKIVHAHLETDFDILTLDNTAWNYRG